MIALIVLAIGVVIGFFYPSLWVLFVLSAIVGVFVFAAWFPWVRRWQVIAVLTLFVIGIFRGALGAVDVSTFLPQTGSQIVGTVVSDPVVQSATVRFSLSGDRGNIMVFTRSSDVIHYGDRVSVRCQSADAGVCFRADVHVLTSARPGLLRTFNQRLSQILSRTIPAPFDGIARAMTLGDKTGITPAVRDLLSATGTSHVVAISGMHIMILATMFMVLFRFFGLSLFLQTIVSIVLLALFVVLVGAPPSAVRGLLFGVLLLLAYASGRPRSVTTVFVIGLAAMLFVHPAFLIELGFHLSFLATLGIVVAVPAIDRTIPRVRIPDILPDRAPLWLALLPHRLVHGALALSVISLSATVFTLPLIMVTFGLVPVYGIIANVLVVPFVSVIMVTSLLVALAGVISSSLAAVIAVVPTVLIALIIGVLRMVTALPGSTITAPMVPTWAIAFIYIGLFSFAMRELLRPRFPRGGSRTQ